MLGKLHLAVCDDSAEARTIVSSAVTKAFAALDVAADVACFSSADELWRTMKTAVFDLLLLDVDMPDCDGIKLGDVLRSTNIGTEIIFVSNRDDKVFDSFRVHPFAFVRKSRFTADIADVLKSYLTYLAKNDEALTVVTKHGLAKEKIVTIRYFEGNGKTQLMYCGGNSAVVVSETMDVLEKKLSDKGFLRVHQGFLVNYRYVSCFKAECLELTDGTILPVSRRKQKEVKAQFLALSVGTGSVVV